MTPYVISGGRVYVPRPEETRAAIVARAALESVHTPVTRPERDAR